MSTWAWALLTYVLIGACYGMCNWRYDRQRAQRSRDLRRSLDIKAPGHPVWVEVLAVSLVRAVAWPFHLIIHDL